MVLRLGIALLKRNEDETSFGHKIVIKKKKNSFHDERTTVLVVPLNGNTTRPDALSYDK